jgi:hypothetical protein
MDATEIIAALGGKAAVAAETGADLNTVTYWERRKGIPAKHWPTLISMADRIGAKVTPEVLLQHRVPAPPKMVAA